MTTYLLFSSSIPTISKNDNQEKSKNSYPVSPIPYFPLTYENEKWGKTKFGGNLKKYPDNLSFLRFRGIPKFEVFTTNKKRKKFKFNLDFFISFEIN